MYYLFVALVLVVAELIYFRVADKCNIIDKPNERSSHTRITLRGGGIIFYIGVLYYFLTNGFAYPWFMLGLTGIAAVSFADDVRSVSQRTRLVVQFASMALMFVEWGIGGMPWWWAVVALVFCTGIINAYNFMDGINGITGGYSLVVLGGLAYVNAQVVPFADGRLIGVAMLAAAIFCYFNFRRRAKCFAGDVGSVSIAFVILFLLGRLVMVTGDLSYLVFLAVYGVDSVLTIVHRLMLGEDIGQPHRKHMYQLMANELRMPHTLVSALYMGIQGGIIAGYLAIPSHGYLYLAGCVACLAIVYVLFMKKFFHLHSGVVAVAVRSGASRFRFRFQYLLLRIRMFLF